MAETTKKRKHGPAPAARVLFSLLFTLIVLLAPTSAGSAGMMCFTAVNDTLLPLRGSTLPTYFNSVLYVPYNIFAYADIFNARSTVDNVVCLYKGPNRLDFYIDAATYDQDGKLFSGVVARYSGATVYVPLGFVCDYFDLSYSVLPREPASILRIKSSAAVYSDKAFADRFKSQMQESYNEYYGIGAPTPTPSPTPPTTTSPPWSGGVTPVTPTPTPTPVYEDVTVYLSFYRLGDGYLAPILDTLDAFGVRACFFVSRDDIAANPDAIRSVAGAGHSLGILLSTESNIEFAEASAMLFEAAKVRTVLAARTPFEEEYGSISETGGGAVASSPVSDMEPVAPDLSPDLIYLGVLAESPLSETASPRDIAQNLAVVGGSVQNLTLPCSLPAASVLRSVAVYLAQYKYNVSLLTETSARPTS